MLHLEPPTDGHTYGWFTPNSRRFTGHGPIFGAPAGRGTAALSPGPAETQNSSDIIMAMMMCSKELHSAGGR